jgi:hypothetical protein
VPEEPLEALELARRLGPGLVLQAPGHLVNHGQAHGDVEPVDQVLRLGVEVEGKLSTERSRYLGAAGRLAEALLDSDDASKALSVLEPALLGEGAAWEPLVRIAVRCEAALGNPEGIRRRVGALEDAIGEDRVSGETRDLAQSLLTTRRRSGPEQPGLRVVPDDQMSAAGGS